MSDFIKCVVTDKGDSSVGIFPTIWELDTPFNREDVEDEETFAKELEFFRNKIRELYSEFAQGKLCVDFDFEINDENGF